MTAKLWECVMYKLLFFSFTAILLTSLTGCTAKKLNEHAKIVKIVYERPSETNCKYLGDVIGTQGNSFSGDFTPNDEMIMGARNELRNKTHEMGGNIIFVEKMHDSSYWGSMGTTNITIIGQAFKCR